MEEADRLMLTTLRNLQCDLDSEISSISQLTAEQVTSVRLHIDKYQERQM